MWDTPKKVAGGAQADVVAARPRVHTRGGRIVVVSDAPERPVLQMRLVVRAEDYDEALRFYRDVLGTAEELQVHGEDGKKVTILDVGRATLELSNPAQVEMIDQVEVGEPVSPHLRVAFEVSDVEGATQRLIEAGAELLAPPTRTPWDSLNARLRGPGGLQITLFQELGDS